MQSFSSKFKNTQEISMTSCICVKGTGKGESTLKDPADRRAWQAFWGVSIMHNFKALEGYKNLGFEWVKSSNTPQGLCVIPFTLYSQRMCWKLVLLENFSDLQPDE